MYRLDDGVRSSGEKAIDVVRTTVKARNKSPHAISLIAREIDGIGAGMLEAFAENKLDLGPDALKSLTKIVYQNAEFDPELNLLRSIAPPATLMASHRRPTSE